MRAVREGLLCHSTFQLLHKGTQVICWVTEQSVLTASMLPAGHQGGLRESPPMPTRTAEQRCRSSSPRPEPGGQRLSVHLSIDSSQCTLPLGTSHGTVTSPHTQWRGTCGHS